MILQSVQTKVKTISFMFSLKIIQRSEIWREHQTAQVSKISRPGFKFCIWVGKDKLLNFYEPQCLQYNNGNNSRLL